MAQVEKSVLVGFPARRMYDLVSRVEDYPQFLPWCGGTEVSRLDGETVRATVHIDYHHIKHSFTTQNTHRVPERIDMVLVDGPFHILDGHWRFLPLAEDACKVEFRLHYEFSHKLLEQVLAPVFHMIANSFVDAFVARAEAGAR